MNDAKQRLEIPGPLGFGGAPLGDMFERGDDATARTTLEAAWDHGIRHFDTSPHYGVGVSEQRMGALLATKPRDEYFLSTKVGRLLEPSPSGPEAQHPFVHGLWFRRRLDYGGDAAKRCVEDSLQRMGVGRLDVVYIHDLAEDALGSEWTEHFRVAMGGAAKALTELRDQGVIRGWGLGVNRAEPCVRALDEADPDVFLLATQYHLLDQSGGEQLFPKCLERGVRVVVGSPYGSGVLAGGAHYNYQEARDEPIALRDRIASVCERHGVDIKAAALQFSAAHPAVAAIIPGAKRPDRIPQNVELMKTPISADLWADLKAEGLLSPDAHVPG
jgi:D-threo-aldose 1-dehydrogenase